MSVEAMVSMFPKRNEGRSGMNPGVRKQQMIPMLIPNVHTKAMAESSRMSFLLPIHCTPKALNTANIIAEMMGFMPVSTPMPIPPNEAWVIPPLINTRRRVTM